MGKTNVRNRTVESNKVENKPSQYQYEDKEEKSRRSIQNAALNRYLRSRKLTYGDIVTLQKLIKIKENSLIHKSMVQKYKKSQDLYKVEFRNIINKMRVDSNLELDLESLINLREPDESYGYEIQGTTIVKKALKKPNGRRIPQLFQYKHEQDPMGVQNTESNESVSATQRGIIRYKLSDRTFIDKGWTMLPIEKVVRKKNIYRVVPAHPEFNWFTKNMKKGPMKYDTGEKLAEFDDNGRGRWFYKNGRLALNYYDCAEPNAQQRYLVYSSGDPDERGRSRPVTLLAMFDLLGNGVVFDHSGKIRIKYNQSDGVVLDRGLGPVSHWKWHSLNDPPVLQRVMMDTYIEEKDPEIMKLASASHKIPRQDFTDMLEIEFSNCIKDQTQKLTKKFKPYQIKMKALKINEQFSLRIVDQANVYLIFRDGSANFRINLGMILDNKQILSTETEEVGEVSVSLDQSRDPTSSVLNLQKGLRTVRRLEHARTNRALKIRPVVPQPSVENLTAAISKPLYPLRTQTSKTSDVPCERICQRKPPQSNLYYNNQLL